MDSNLIKNKSKLLKDLSKKYGYDIAHSHALEIMSQLENQVNWHVTVAKSKDYIRTGISELDKSLTGGLKRGELISIVGDMNSGKNLFCISIASNAIRDGKKVLIVNLQGERDDSMKRIISNFCKIPFDKINEDLFNNNLSVKEKEKIKNANKVFKDKLIIRNMIEFDVSIEELISELTQIKKDFDFDLVYINHGSFLKSNQFKEKRKNIAYVFRSLNTNIARNMNCTVITPVNTSDNRKSSEIIQMKDVNEAFEIARVSNTILSLNSNEEERENNQMRIFLEKQRHGVKNVQFGIYTDFSKCNLIDGEYFVNNKDIK